MFEDLTKEELADIYNNVSFVSTAAKTGTYTTLVDDEESIPIPIQDLDPDDILFVTIDGVSLTEGIDYTRSGNGINMTNPIPDAGTTVVFRAIGYSLPDGEKNIVINQTYDDLTNITNLDIDTMMEEPDESTEQEGENG